MKRHKNDAPDAEAICEAVTRPHMRFVETTSTGQQSVLVLHRARHLFMKQQISLINAIRAHLAEFGIVAPVGRSGVEDLLYVIADPDDDRLPEVARECLAALGALLQRTKAQLLEFDRMIIAWHRSNEACRRLDDIPGVGPALATALVASVPDPKNLSLGTRLRSLDRTGAEAEFERWQGEARRRNQAGRSLSAESTHDKVRWRLYVCQTPALAYCSTGAAAGEVAAVALANKIARMAWAMMAKGERLQGACRAGGMRSRRIAGVM